MTTKSVLTKKKETTLRDVTHTLENYIYETLKKREKEFFKFKKNSDIFEDLEDFLKSEIESAQDYLKEEPKILKFNHIEMEGYLRGLLIIQSHIKEIESYIEEE